MRQVSKAWLVVQHSGNRVCVRCQAADVVLQIVAQKMGADLEFEKISGDADHGKQQYCGHENHEDVCNDQTIAKTPQESGANPGQHANREINYREQREKAEETQERERMPQSAHQARHRVENYDNQ